MNIFRSAIPASLAAVLAVSGCAAHRPAPSTADAVMAQPPAKAAGSSQYQRANGRANAGVTANSPDNPTGSSAYQSPDLDDKGAGYGARPPNRIAGSQQYQH